MGKKFNEYWSNSPKWARILFWVFLGISAGLLIASWIVPPMGTIDSSVLAAIGELMGFASLGVGFECIFAGMSVSLQKGDTTINVSHDSNCECKTN